MTLDDAMQAEGEGGTVEESWTTNLAAPGGDDEVITFDVEPGNYGLVCFILSADGTLHATARDATRTDRPLKRRHDMKRLTLIALAIAAAVLPCSPTVATSTGALHTAALVAPGGPSPVEASGHATRYYLSLGDSLAESAQLDGDLTHGYAEQLHAALERDQPEADTGQVRLRWRVDGVDALRQPGPGRRVELRITA